MTTQAAWSAACPTRLPASAHDSAKWYLRAKRHTDELGRYPPRGGTVCYCSDVRDGSKVAPASNTPRTSRHLAWLAGLSLSQPFRLSLAGPPGRHASAVPQPPTGIRAIRSFGCSEPAVGACVVARGTPGGPIMVMAKVAVMLAGLSASSAQRPGLAAIPRRCGRQAGSTRSPEFLAVAACPECAASV